MSRKPDAFRPDHRSTCCNSQVHANLWKVSWLGTTEKDKRVYVNSKEVATSGFSNSDNFLVEHYKPTKNCISQMTQHHIVQNDDSKGLSEVWPTKALLSGMFALEPRRVRSRAIRITVDMEWLPRPHHWRPAPRGTTTQSREICSIGTILSRSKDENVPNDGYRYNVTTADYWTHT